MGCTVMDRDLWNFYVTIMGPSQGPYEADSGYILARWVEYNLFPLKTYDFHQTCQQPVLDSRAALPHLHLARYLSLNRIRIPYWISQSPPDIPEAQNFASVGLRVSGFHDLAEIACEVAGNCSMLFPAISGLLFVDYAISALERQEIRQSAKAINACISHQRMALQSISSLQNHSSLFPPAHAF